MHYKYTDIKAIVAEILENKKDEGGVKNIYFVGCGGSLGALYPAKTFMERESLTLKSGWVSSNEFVHSTPRDFGKNSIICLACHKGNTPETIAAAKLGKEMGAAVIILTWLEESEIIEFGDYIIHYSFDASPDHLAGDIVPAGCRHEHHRDPHGPRSCGPARSGLCRGVKERLRHLHHGQRRRLRCRLHGEHLHLHGDAVDPLRHHPHR